MSDVFIGWGAMCALTNGGADCRWARPHAQGPPFTITGAIEVAGHEEHNAARSVVFALFSNGDVRRYCSDAPQVCGNVVETDIDHIDSYEDVDHHLYCRQSGTTITCDYNHYTTFSFQAPVSPALVKELRVGFNWETTGREVTACQLTTTSRLYCTSHTFTLV